MVINSGDIDDRFHPSPEQEEEIEQGKEEVARRGIMLEGVETSGGKVRRALEDDDDDDDRDRDRDRPTGQRYPGGAGGASQPVPQPAPEGDRDDTDSGGDTDRTDRFASPYATGQRYPGGAGGAAQPRQSIALEGAGWSGGKVSAAVERAAAGRDQGIETGGGRGMASIDLVNDAGQEYTYTGPTSEVAERAERQWLDAHPGYTASDIRYVQDESGTVTPELTQSGVERRQQQERVAATRAIDEQLEQQTGLELDPGADYTVTETAEGDFDGVLTPAGMERYARSRASIGPNRGDGEALQRLDRDIEERVGRTFATLSGGFAGGMTPPQAAGEQVELERGEDYFVYRTSEGYVAEPSPSTEREIASTAFEEELENRFWRPFDAGEDFETVATVDEEGETAYRPELTGPGERKVRGDEYEDEVRSIPFPTPLVGTTVDVPISALPGVDDENATFEDIVRPAQRWWLDVADAAGEATGAVSIWNQARFLDTAGETKPEDVPRSFWETTVVDDESEEGPTERQIEAFTSGVVALPATVLGTALATEELREFGLAAYDVAQEDGVGIEARETPVRRVRPGPGPPRRRPGTTVAISDRGAAPFIAEEAEETGEQLISDFVKEVSSPEGRAGLAGSLVGSAVIMGGAGAISSRAGTASRFAIQPGEEMLGYGGYGVTRRVASRSAAERLFPHREPLIFSEEAAIRGLAYGAGKARSGVSRVRTAAGRAEVEPRVGAGLVPPRIRLTSETIADVEATADLDEPTWLPGRGAASPGGRKPTKAGINERGAFVGSYTHGSDPAFGGTGKPGDGTPRDFSSVFDGPEFEFGPRRRTAERPSVEAGGQRFETAATVSGEEESGLGARFAIAEETERVEEAQRRSLDEEPTSPEPAVTLRDRLAETSQPLLAFGAVTEAASERKAEASRATVGTTLRERMAQRADGQSIVDAEGRTGQRTGIETETESRVGLEQELETEVEFETRLEQALDMDTELDLEMEAETELETELEFSRPEIEAETESESDDQERSRSQRFSGLGMFRPPTEAGGPLRPSWLRETFVDMATEGSFETFGREPSQTTLREEAARRPFGGLAELPTYTELYGTPEQKASVEEVKEFFTSSVGVTPDWDLWGGRRRRSRRRSAPGGESGPSLDFGEFDFNFDGWST